MEDKKNNKYGLFWRIFTLCFIMFLCLYSISMNGYVNHANQNKTLYTQEQIEQFEQDVLSGKEIDVYNYSIAPTVDYSNEISDLGASVSKGIDYVANKATNVLESLFEFLFN